MKPDGSVEKREPAKEVKSIGFGPKYLDWWVGHDKPPSYKNLSDNLRAWLTIGAYVALLNYLWVWGDDRIPGWVFQVAAIVWGGVGIVVLRPDVHSAVALVHGFLF